MLLDLIGKFLNLVMRGIRSLVRFDYVTCVSLSRDDFSSSILLEGKLRYDPSCLSVGCRLFSSSFFSKGKIKFWLMNIYPQGSLEFRNISYKWRISHSYNKYKYNTQIQAHKHIHTYTHAHRQQTRFYSSIWPNISSFWDVFYHIISLFIKITYLLLLLPRPYFFTFVRGVVTHVECSASLGLFNLSLYRKVYNMFILSILWIGANTGVSVQVGPALYHLFLKNLEGNYNVWTIF